MLLDENAVYTLPDGREFIARIATHGGYFLHDRLRGASVVPVYLVDRSGQLLSWGRVSRWTAKDLPGNRSTLAARCATYASTRHPNNFLIPPTAVGGSFTSNLHKHPNIFELFCIGQP